MRAISVIESIIHRPNDENDAEENLSLSQANVNDAGEGVGVCRTTAWTDFTPCSATCGIGISMRTRTFVDHAGRKKCPHIAVGNLTEKRNPIRQ